MDNIKVTSDILAKKNEYGQTFLVRNSQFEHGQSLQAIWL